jgi:two-component system alkaline phosphatase synthesis response regulator PhoP
MMHRKVLLVDDEQSILRICSLYLQAEGMTVTALQHANSIVDVVREENPDVIVLDLNLPGTDGFAAVQSLKRAAETANIPILILSGRSSIEDKKTALLLCGADDYMTKPFDPDELVTRISVLHRRNNGLLLSYN